MLVFFNMIGAFAMIVQAACAFVKFVSLQQTFILWIVMMDNLNRKFEAYGLVNIRSVEPSVMVDLKYASTDNFMHQNMYGDLHEAYLLPEVAEKIAAAQRLLKAELPERSIVIYDAARPLSIQKLMFDSVAGTPMEPYIANPNDLAGFHNYGMAVDLTIIENGKPLDMGTPYDFFGDLAHTDCDKAFLESGRLSTEAYANRQFLYGLMERVGMYPLPNEWWHYQYHTEADKKVYRLLDF